MLPPRPIHRALNSAARSVSFTGNLDQVVKIAAKVIAPVLAGAGAAVGSGASATAVASAAAAAAGVALPVAGVAAAGYLAYKALKKEKKGDDTAE